MILEQSIDGNPVTGLCFRYVLLASYESLSLSLSFNSYVQFKNCVMTLTSLIMILVCSPYTMTIRNLSKTFHSL